MKLNEQEITKNLKLNNSIKILPERKINIILEYMDKKVDIDSLPANVNVLIKQDGIWKSANIATSIQNIFRDKLSDLGEYFDKAPSRDMLNKNDIDYSALTQDELIREALKNIEDSENLIQMIKHNKELKEKNNINKDKLNMIKQEFYDEEYNYLVQSNDRINSEEDIRSIRSGGNILSALSYNYEDNRIDSNMDVRSLNSDYQNIKSEVDIDMLSDLEMNSIGNVNFFDNTNADFGQAIAPIVRVASPNTLSLNNTQVNSNTGIGGQNYMSKKRKRDDVDKENASINLTKKIKLPGKSEKILDLLFK